MISMKAKKGIFSKVDDGKCHDRGFVFLALAGFLSGFLFICSSSLFLDFLVL